MKKKGIAVTIFFGFILLTSTIMIAIPGLTPEEENPDITITCHSATKLGSLVSV